MTVSADAAETIVEIFDHDAIAVAAVRELKKAGFSESQIDIAFHETCFDATDQHSRSEVQEGAMVGCAAGIVSGGLWGLAILAQIAPGIAVAFSSSPAGVLLSSMAVGALILGMIGALIGMGFQHQASAAHPLPLTECHAVVTVNAGERVGFASTLLHRFSHLDQTRPQAS